MENKDYIIALESINSEDLPQVITSTFEDIKIIDKQIKECESLAQTAKDCADVAHRKSAGWSFFGTNKKEAIEALQTAAVAQSNALSTSIDANKLLFSYQVKIANSIGYLFGLGVTNLAANRTVVRELELKLKNASKEQLSELAKQEIHNVILQLRAQEDMFYRINGHDNLLREHKNDIDKTSLHIEQLEGSIKQFKQSCQQTLDETKQVQSDIKLLKINVTNSLNQLPSQFATLEKNMHSSLNQSVEKSKKHIDELQNQLKKDNEDSRKIINKELASAISNINDQVKNIQETFDKIEKDYTNRFNALETNFANQTNELKQSISNFVKNEVANSMEIISIKNEELSKRIDSLQEQLNKKSFFDTSFYKIIIGLLAIISLTLHFISFQ